jgi:hypothetical protein
VTAKPTVCELGIDLAAQVWHRSGHGDGAIEIAFTRAAGNTTAHAAGNITAHTAGDTTAHAAGNITAHAAGDTTAHAAGNITAHAAWDTTQPPADRAEWVLMRVTGDPDGRVLVFDRHEWECFLDGARNGEFDDGAASS